VSSYRIVDKKANYRNLLPVFVYVHKKKKGRQEVSETESATVISTDA
jgi:hypothetical protein